VKRRQRRHLGQQVDRMPRRSWGEVDRVVGDERGDVGGFETEGQQRRSHRSGRGTDHRSDIGETHAVVDRQGEQDP